MDQFDEARDDFNQASKAVDQVRDVNADNDKKAISEALKSLQFDSTLVDHWVSYLKQIQTADNYQNWSSAPYDLYAERQRLAKLAVAAVSRVPTVPGPLGPPWYLVYLEWALGVLGFAATYLYFTRSRG